jgi:peptide chain release factor subunit 1
MVTRSPTRSSAADRSSEGRHFHARAASLLHELARREETELPLISAYVDLRPPRDQADPAVRATRIVLRDRLREIGESLPRHGPVRKSFAADAARIEGIIDDEAGNRERGLAVFACHGDGLLEVLRTWNAFELVIEAGPLPSLVPLARLVDHEPAIVALADTNSLRLFVFQPGRLLELPAIDDPPDDYTRTEVGGWSQARYQRHVDEHRDAFARRAATVIARAMERETAERLLLAGDEVAVPRLREALPTPVASRVRDVLRMELRATVDEIEAKAMPVIADLEAADARDAADRLVGAIAHGTGVGRPRPTQGALKTGAVMELLLDDAIGNDDAKELVRLAAGSAARITFVPGHRGLQELGGVGALLRYQLGPTRS